MPVSKVTTLLALLVWVSVMHSVNSKSLKYEEGVSSLRASSLGTASPDSIHSIKDFD